MVGKYVRSVAFFTFASSVPWTCVCGFSRIPGFKVDAKWKISMAFAISALGFVIEEPAKMATYMGFYLPKVLETVNNMFQTDSYSSRFLSSSALWLFITGAILGLSAVKKANKSENPVRFDGILSPLLDEQQP